MLDTDIDLPLATDQVVVGETYMVPCVSGIPVIGDRHVDSDHFNVTPLHWHCDSRFHDSFNVEICGMQPLDPVYEPRTCIRDTPKRYTPQELAYATMALHLDYHDCLLKGGRCPHKSMPVINGVCSGHRLEWLPDGTIRRKPPYTIEIAGTGNKVVLERLSEKGSIDIPITVEQSPGRHRIEMYDAAGELMASTSLPYLGRFMSGDIFKLVPTHA